MPLSPITKMLGLAPPFLLRVFTSESDWGVPSDELESRVRNAVENGFLKRHTSPFSFFHVESDTDLARIVMAFNGNRLDPLSKIVLVPFQRPELIKHSPQLDSTLGLTKCGYANRRHWDWSASDNVVGQLCREVMMAGRGAFRIAKKDLREIVTLAQAESCAAAPGAVESCKVEECVREAAKNSPSE